MAGRYFTLPDSQYSRESQYVPLPFDRIMAAAQGKQRQYDKVDEDIYNTQKMFKIDADPIHREYRDKKIAEYNNRLAAIADEFHKKGEVAQLPGKIRNLARDYANDPEVIGLNQNYKNYLESQKDVSKLTSEGKYDPMYDTYWGQFAKQHNPKEQGFIPFDYKGTKSMTDYIKPADETMAGIAKHGFESGSYKLDSEGNIIDSKTGKKGVYEQDVRKVAKANVSSFLQNPESVYFMDRLRNSNPNITPEQINREAEELLYNRGIKQIGEEIKNEKSFRYGPSDIRKEAKEAKEGLLGTFAQSGIKDNNIFTGELSVFNGILKADPSTGTVNVDNEALHDKLKPQGLAKWSGILPDKYFKHNDTPYKALFAISRDLGLNKDETGKEIPGNEQVLKTLTYLQNLNTSAGSNYVPVEPVRDALGTKLLNSSDKEQMVGDPGETMNSFLKDNPQFIDEKTGKTRGKLAQLTLDGNKAKVLFKFTDKEGNEVNKEFTPGNKTYQEAFNRIAKIPTETKKLILDPKSRNQEDVSEAAAALGISSGKNRQYITSKLGNIQNLEPIGKINIDGETTVYMYKDKTNPDVVKAIRYNENKKIFTPEESTSNVVNSYMSDLFNKDEFRDVTGKINKRMETQSFETPEE